MSEKQARLKRKNAPQEETRKPKKSVWGNVIITIVVIAFLGLAGYALKDNIKSILPKRPEKEKTVSDIAKEKELTVEEFIETYGLTDAEVTQKTTESELMSKFTVANYAKYLGQTTEELMAAYGLEGIDENMLWQEAMEYMPMLNYAQNMGMTFDEFKKQSGLPDEITEKTTLKEAEEIMASMSASEEPEERNEEETAETDAE